MVLGGRVAGPRVKTVPLRTILGTSNRSRRAGRATRTAWGTAAWGAALLGCATGAFAVRDTMFPTLGRTEAPSAWQAPTRPIVTVPYLDREGPLGSTSSVGPGAAAGGSPLVVASDDTVVTTVGDHQPEGPSTATTVAGADPAPPSATTPAVTTPSGGHPGSSVPTVSSPGASSPDPSAPTSSSSPTTTDGATATTTGDTLVDDGGGNQRGRGSGGSAGSVP